MPSRKGLARIFIALIIAMAMENEISVRLIYNPLVNMMAFNNINGSVGKVCASILIQFNYNVIQLHYMLSHIYVPLNIAKN